MTTEARPGEPRAYLTQLTSLRGVACLVVLIGHVIQVVHYHAAVGAPGFNLAHEVIAAAFNAEGAVLLFFVLSGCVLSLSLQNVTQFHASTVLSFYVKRVFRLYPLLWLATAVAMLSMVASRHLVATGVFVDWLARNLDTRFTAAHTVLSFTGLYTRYNGPMWSLRVELIYSALFPAIYLLVKHPRGRVWTLGMLTAIAILPIPSQLGMAFGLSFAAGAVIPFLRSAQPRAHGGIALAALLVILYDRFALAGLHPPDRVYDIIETIAAFCIVREVYASGRGYRLLLARPVIWLGELSFSIYLLHLPIFLMIFTCAEHFLGLSVLLGHAVSAQLLLAAATAALTIAVSVVTYHGIELPLHNIGRRLGRQVARRGGGRPAGQLDGARPALPLA